MKNYLRQSCCLALRFPQFVQVRILLYIRSLRNPKSKWHAFINRRWNVKLDATMFSRMNFSVKLSF